MNKIIVLRGEAVGLGDLLTTLYFSWAICRSTKSRLAIDWRHTRYLHDNQANLFELLFGRIGEIMGVSVIYPDALELGDLDSFDLRDLAHAKLGKAQFIEEIMASAEANVIIFSREGIEPFMWLNLPDDDKIVGIIEDLENNFKYMSLVDKFYQEKFDDDMIGIHYRHGNREKHFSKFDRIDVELATIQEQARKFSSTGRKIFLCTDHKASEESFKRRYDNIIVRPKAFAQEGQGPLHESRQGEKEAINAAVEMILLSRVKLLICNASLFTIAYARRILGPDKVIRIRGNEAIHPAPILGPARYRVS